MDAAAVFATPVDGFHWYISPPDAVTATVSPTQMPADVGLIANTGCGLTVIETLSVEEQWLFAVTVT